MKTKFGLPLGLALVMFIGVFTTMLALGALNPQPAEAAIGIAANSVMVARSTDADGAYADWTFSAQKGTNDSPVNDDITIAFTGYGIGEDCAADVDTTAVCTETNWSATVLAGADPVADPAITLTVTSVATTESTSTAVITIGTVIPGGRFFEITFTSPDGESGIQNPSVAGIAAVSVGGQSKDLVTYDTTVDDVTVAQDPTDPGAGARYQIKFVTAYTLSEGTDDIILDIDSSVGVPTSLSSQDVRISADMVTGTGSTPNQNRPLDDAPRYRVLDGTDGRTEYRISIPDMDTSPDRNASIAAGATVTLTLQANAGFTNPTEAGDDDITVSTTRQTVGVKAEFTTAVRLSSDDKGANRNNHLTITGKGFKNGTSVTVFLDKDGNGARDGDDVDLTPPITVASDDTFEATFTVTVPPFKPGKDNMINAVDGENPPNTAENGVPFEVEGLLRLSPASLGIGDTLSIDLIDWPNERISKVLIGGEDHTPSSPPTVTNNRLQFDVVVDDDVRLGDQQVRVETEGEADTANVLISGADLVLTPTTVVPNQSISVTGRGFHGGAEINDDGDSSVVSLDGDPIKMAGGNGSNKINDGDKVSVDNGGNWNASIVIPVTGTSITPGPHEIKVIDTGGREGVAIVNVAERTLSLSPTASRVGTTVTVTGAGFPGRNSATGSEGVQVVQIEYNENGTFRTVASVTPDSSGSFTTTFQVPLNAGIPSTNSVRATFSYDATGDIRTLTTHEIPEGGITLSASEAMPGDTITVTGEGFKAFRAVNSIMIGTIEATPSPKPSTDAMGTFTASFLVPGLDLGIKNVSVDVGDTTANASLDIIEAAAGPMMPGDGMMMNEAMAPAMAFAPVVAEENLVKVFHFDPATQNEAPTTVGPSTTRGLCSWQPTLSTPSSRAASTSSRSIRTRWTWRSAA